MLVKQYTSILTLISINKILYINKIYMLNPKPKLKESTSLRQLFTVYFHLTRI